MSTRPTEASKSDELQEQPKPGGAQAPRVTEEDAKAAVIWRVQEEAQKLLVRRWGFRLGLAAVVLGVLGVLSPVWVQERLHEIAKDALDEKIVEVIADQTETLRHIKKEQAKEQHALLAAIEGVRKEAEAFRREIAASRESLLAEQQRITALSDGYGELLARQAAGAQDVQAQITEFVRIRNIYFDYNAATVRSESHATLDAIARVLESRPSIRLRIEAHNDSIASEAYNQRLTEQRAESVKTALVERGVEPSRLEAVGFGETKPVAPNDTPEGRSENRRVEFRVLASSGSAP